MIANRQRCRLATLAFLVAAGTASGQQPDDLEAQVRRFVAQHCADCHGPDVQRRKLRLDTLPFQFGDKDAAAAWDKVVEQIARGDMPPRNKPRLAEKETQAVLAGLRRRLHDASFARQQRDGRVLLRRLNRVEYETTLGDLLAAPVEVRDLLPDDNTAAGFDNVSAVLDVSSTHLLRYQEAADKALRSVIPSRPLFEFTDRRTGKEIAEKTPGFKDMLGKSARLDGDTLILFARPYNHVPCATATVPQAGRYRLRASVAAVGTDKPLPVRCICEVQYGPTEGDVRIVRDVPPGKSVVIEGEFDLKARQRFIFVGWTLPTMREFGKKGGPDYTGPGLAVEWLEIEGPFNAWPPAGYQRLFAGVPLKPQSVARAEAGGRPAPAQPAKRSPDSYIYDPLVPAPAKPREDAERLLRAFLPLAFRRPVSEELQQYYVKLVHAALDKKVPFTEAMILGYQAVLCSPHFLFLSEPTQQNPADQRTRLDDHAVASRLAYFLWSSMPDDELLSLAAKGVLRKPEVLREQVERLLKDPKARRFTANFAGQWLELRNINATSPDPQIYGEFDDFLFWSMPRETERFFEEVLRADRSLTEFVHSDWTFLNQRLAQHYGIPDVHGGEMRLVKLPPGSHRGGVLTQASVLKITADGTRTSPILRGKWVLERILGQPPAPPPPDVPSIEPDIRGATTIRQQLDKHRNTAACATCHRHIDPPGFALENFDPIGGWRDFYRGTRGKPTPLANYPGRNVPRGADVEKGGETADGRKFQDIDEYKQLLLADKDQLARNLAEKLLVYSTGAEIQYADREVVEQLVARSREQKYGFRSLIHDVVQSRVFLNK